LIVRPRVDVLMLKFCSDFKIYSCFVYLRGREKHEILTHGDDPLKNKWRTTQLFVPGVILWHTRRQHLYCVVTTFGEPQRCQTGERLRLRLVSSEICKAGLMPALRMLSICMRH